MECHRALRLYLLSANERHCHLSTTTYHALKLFCLFAFKRQTEYMLYDMLVHVVKSLFAIILPIGCAHTHLPVRIPTMRYSQAQIAGPSHRHCRIVCNLPYRIGHILGSKHIPMSRYIIRCQQRSTEHSTRGTESQQLILHLLLETIKKSYIHFDDLKIKVEN